ncbi:protein required for maturation of hydrogenases [Desulfamplus magnetovallimortis]|uniref:Protein required for maturation of hydrogenases n=1 Tax=Desulfamplus magnetovallimortis TaxID=1246637 RepID=A0A1W1HCF6_9BACT|nr:hydrogenase formation protein HypD [Desulfamplus magnetovallimortis]SLM30174.1 protein required for maturation of hydrogenases [Desulfamplus magnetovallimortis]
MSLKFVHEYRDGSLAKQLIAAIHGVKGAWMEGEPLKVESLPDNPKDHVQKPVRKKRRLRLMEVCGTHTMSIFRHGIPSVLPRGIELLSGPGCPVCVTAQQDIDAFVELALQKNVIVTTFGDLMRVPGRSSSLQQEKAGGREVRIVYSVFDALKTAQQNPDREIVFCAVGFETTIPTVAAAILMADEQQIENFSIHCAHKITPPALAALMETPEVSIDGFLLPGHVSVITGTDGYKEVFQRYQVPSVIAGFEPVDILRGIYMLVLQNHSGYPLLENAYERAVSKEGNPKARQMMAQVFDTVDAVWRGIGTIPLSGMVLKEKYIHFDALKKFDISPVETPEPAGCACGEILMGLKTPLQCALYGKKCTPVHPVGPCMVSSEGACAAHYKYMV